jgi:nitrous oxide reductase
MSLYVLRLRDGNCIVVDAPSEEKAMERAKPLAASEIATARKLASFVAQFSLTDEGELTAILLEKETVAELHEHEYPMLNAAHAQSYMDFNASETDSKTDAVLFNQDATVHAQQWDRRDEQIIHYAVEQERLRFAN